MGGGDLGGGDSGSGDLGGGDSGGGDSGGDSGDDPGGEQASAAAHHAVPQQQEATQPGKSGTVAGVGRAVQQAVDRGARVINISVAACTDPRLEPAGIADLRAALRHAEEAGSVVIAAAGNVSGPCKPDMNAYPAHEPTVLAVSATADDPHQKAEYSLAGGDIAALGGPMRGTGGANPLLATADPQEQRSNPAARIAPTPHPFVGTSFAAPLVSGVAALIVQLAPELTAQEIREVLEATASPGAGAATGMVDPAAAVNRAMILHQQHGNATGKEQKTAGQRGDDAIALPQPRSRLDTRGAWRMAIVGGGAMLGVAAVAFIAGLGRRSR